MDGKELSRRIKEGLPIIADGRPIIFTAHGRDTDPHRHYRNAIYEGRIPIHCYTPEEFDAELRSPSSSALLGDAASQIAELKHTLRKMSERFEWLGEHHVSSQFAKRECKMLSEECWTIQAKE